MDYNIPRDAPQANDESGENDAGNLESHILHKWEIYQRVGQPPAIIRVRNLQASLQVGKDAWGRLGKQQPVLISANVSLRAPFVSASTNDAVTTSTIHYGTLSKAILEACQLSTKSTSSQSDASLAEENSSLASLTNATHFFLTHFNYPKLSRTILNKKGDSPILTPDIFTMLEITVLLPKASLPGSGVSFTQSLWYDGNHRECPSAISLVLGIHDLRIPTLIGVNPNERLAKQIVIANVEIDPWTRLTDVYNELEQVVVKTIEESSFQTLEALATHLGDRIIDCFIIPYGEEISNSDRTWRFPDIKICLEKPTAVTFADAPVVELVVPSDPQRNIKSEQLYKNAANSMARAPPYPLQGKLGEWLEHNPRS